MTAATLRMPVSLPETRKAAAPLFLKRFFQAMMEARLRQAARELRMYEHLVPQDEVKKAGYAASVTNDAALPLTR